MLISSFSWTYDGYVKFKNFKNLSEGYTGTLSSIFATLPYDENYFNQKKKKEKRKEKKQTICEDFFLEDALTHDLLLHNYFF